MVARKETMEKLVACSERRIRMIGMQLVEMKTHTEELNGKLLLLQHYAEEYRRGMNNNLQEGIGAAECRNYHRFMSQLEQAVVVQREVLRTHDRQLSELQERWIVARRRKLAYETLQVRMETEEQCIALRRMQRQMDELAHRARVYVPQLA